MILIKRISTFVSNWTMPWHNPWRDDHHYFWWTCGRAVIQSLEKSCVGWGRQGDLIGRNDGSICIPPLSESHHDREGEDFRSTHTVPPFDSVESQGQVSCDTCMAAASNWYWWGMWLNCLVYAPNLVLCIWIACFDIVEHRPGSHIINSLISFLIEWSEILNEISKTINP